MNNNLCPLSTALKTAIKSPVLTELHHFRMIQKHWKLIMGSEHLSEVITPLKLSQKTLFVLVADAAYSEHFSYYIENLIALIASEPICGEGKVTKVRFRVGEKPEIQEEPPETEELKVRKLDSETSETIVKTASNIEDEELREAFIKYMTKIKSINY